MSDRKSPSRSPKRPYLLTSSTAQNASLNVGTSFIGNSDIEQTPSSSNHSKDRNEQEVFKDVITEQEPSLANGPHNTNVTLRIATTDEKTSFARRHSFCSNIPCGRTLLKLLFIYGLIATGIGGYLLRQFFRIPSLQNEVNQLTEQVDRLQNEIIALQYVLE